MILRPWYAAGAKMSNLLPETNSIVSVLATKQQNTYVEVKKASYESASRRKLCCVWRDLLSVSHGLLSTHAHSYHRISHVAPRLAVGVANLWRNDTPHAYKAGITNGFHVMHFEVRKLHLLNEIKKRKIITTYGKSKFWSANRDEN